MATQHPDSASKRVSVREEPEEALECFSKDGLGCDEYLIDYMGKLTPYHQIGQIVKRLIEETDLIPGEDVMITPRMVSSFREEPFRQLMTTLAIVEGIHSCYRRFGMQGIIYIIQAVTSSMEDLKFCKERSESLLKLAGKHLNMNTDGMFIRMIPLFGGMAEHLSIKQHIPNMIGGGYKEDHVRIFIGKSEASLLYGHMASVLSCKMAISDCYEMEGELGLKVYPMLGVGALPFRGHFTFNNVNNILREYGGTHTFTIQSGLRYDHGAEETRSLIETIRSKVPNTPINFDSEEIEKMRRSIFIFAKNYLIALSEIQDVVLKLSEFIPKQRERLLEVEEVSYYRELMNVENILTLCEDKDVRRGLEEFEETTLKRPPRWTGFVASTYTCGLPPEFLGTGKALEEIGEALGSSWLDKLLEEIYPTLREDILFASKFLISDPDINILMTERIAEDIEILRETFDFEGVNESYMILSEVANSYLKEILFGKPMRRKKIAILVSDEEVAEYFDGDVRDNISRIILDLGRIRKSLA